MINFLRDSFYDGCRSPQYLGRRIPVNSSMLSLTHRRRYGLCQFVSQVHLVGDALLGSVGEIDSFGT